MCTNDNKGNKGTECNMLLIKVIIWTSLSREPNKVLSTQY